jgi:signal transduction histidine kinase/CheY-like chemotaxis protein
MSATNMILTQPIFIEELDQGLGICQIDTLVFIEWNNTLGKWLNLTRDTDCPDASPQSLIEILDELELKRLRKSINKNRKFRFRRTLNGPQAEEIAFNTKIVGDEQGKQWLYLQACIDYAAREARKMASFKKNYDEILLERDRATAASEAKSQFLATMSHELRTPMNSILGIAQQLRKTRLEEEQTQYLEIIQGSGKQLLNIINEILDFSKIAAGKIELHTESTNISQLTQEVFDMCGYDTRRSPDTQLILENNTGDLPYIMIDRTRIRQVLINLLSNAIKFTRHGQVIFKSNGIVKNKICDLTFEIHDTGIGIAEERIEIVFDPFIQADGTTTRQFSGTGLGLSISLQLVELMGGNITVSSVLQKGSCFTVDISLPICEVLPEHHPTDCQFGRRLGDSLDNIRLCGKRILVVDDITINCDLVRMALDEFDLNLVIAHNGQEALDQFTKEEPFDLILMDCLMPFMDGFTATQKIRQLESARNNAIVKRAVPIIALTASASENVLKKCREAGMDDVMLKPFDFNDLIKRVDYWCRRVNPSH